jgi:predicted nucleic acid-binding protein
MLLAWRRHNIMYEKGLQCMDWRSLVPIYLCLTESAHMSLKVVLDTNCFIDACNPAACAHQAMQAILQASKSSRLRLLVSLHSLHELAQKPDAAYALAESLEPVPHWPIGAWKDQVGTWGQAAGTWEDAGRNQAIQKDLQTLAKSGTDIHDRGAYIDALLAGADVFVTSDRQLADPGPAERIAQKYGLRVLSPSAFAPEAEQQENS